MFPKRQIVSKPMKYNKNADILLFLLLFTTSQREKNIEKTFVSAAARKRWKTVGSGSTLPQYLPNPKSKFPAKFILRKVYLSYFQLTKKLKRRFH